MMIVKCINASIQALRITFSIMLQEFMSSDINLCDLKHNRLNNLGDSWTQRCHERGHYKLPVNTRREAVVTIWFLSRLIIEDEAKSCCRAERLGAFIFLFHNDLEPSLVWNLLPPSLFPLSLLNIYPTACIRLSQEVQPHHVLIMSLVATQSHPADGWLDTTI